MGKRRISVKVSFDIPGDCTNTECVDYVRDAVATMKGGYNPESDIFSLNGDSVIAVSMGEISNGKG